MFFFLDFLFGCMVGWFVTRYGTKLWSLKSAVQRKLEKKLDEIEKEIEK